MTVHELDSGRPRIRFRHEGEQQELECDVIAGCDGFHGVCRPSIPAGVLRTFSREYPFGWLGILAAVAPSNDELVYAHHERGFALLSLRSPGALPALRPVPPRRGPRRLAGRADLGGAAAAARSRRLDARGGPDPREGRHRRCAASSPSRCSTAASSSPATRRTSSRRPAPRASTSRSPTCACSPRRSSRWYETGDEDLLAAYSADCLRRVWRAEHFSWWMTSMLHIAPACRSRSTSSCSSRSFATS